MGWSEYGIMSLTQIQPQAQLLVPSLVKRAEDPALYPHAWPWSEQRVEPEPSFAA